MILRSYQILICVLLILVVNGQFSNTPYKRPAVLTSNFRLEKSSSAQHSPIRLQEPLSLPIILTNPGEYKSNRPLFQKYSLRKYQLYDSNYLPDLSKISRLDEELAYNMEPPSGVFEESSKIVIQNYRLLQIKQFKITLINPSQRYRFCIEEIFIDSQQITRQEKRPLPFCINSTTKYPFFFSLYITEHKPLIFKGTVYFIITIYDGQQLVDQKIWPKQIIVKVTHNHLRIIPLEIRNCNKDNSIVMIRNPQKWDLSLVIIYKRKLYQLTGQPIDGNIIIPAQKSYKFIIDGKDSKMTIYTKSVAIDITYPVLYVPIYCIQDLVVDYFNIGILSDDRSLLQFPVTVSSYSNNTIFVQEITLKSSTQSVQLLPLKQNYNNYQIQPNVRHYIVARIIIHGSRANVQSQRSYFQVGIKYMMQVQGKQDGIKDQIHQTISSEMKIDQQIQFQVRQTRTTYHYCQMRSPISVGTKRYIDISKLSDPGATISENSFPVRNNLNLPVNLIRVIYDQSKFKLLWLQDRRDYIFPNHQRDEFSLQYIGSRNLQISPMKYIALLQFNGNLFIPLEVVIYDRTLQCVYEDAQNGKPIKCADLSTLQFGYFNQQYQQSNNSTKQKLKIQQSHVDRFLSGAMQTKKTKRISIRNWNPQSKNVKVGIQQNSIQKYGFNTTVRVLGPYPAYQVLIRSQGNIHELYLKGNHYIILQIQLVPLKNATSGTLPLRILTIEQHITKPIKFKVQNGTIALIPQISRFQSSYRKTVEYLNLVSTYKQPYRIKSIHSNMSNLMVYCNNYSEIYENQWIGMALIYEPFWGEWNITQQCCSQRRGVQRLFRQLRIGGHRPIPVQITLKTTTQLQAHALVLIDRSSPPLIQLPYSHQFSIRQKFRKDAERIDIHLIDDGNVEKFQYKLKIKNIFQETLKGNILIFDEQLIQRLEEYMNYRVKMSERITTYFCLRNDVKVKHNFTPSLIKNLFQLSALPLQITVEPLTNTSFYINSPFPPREEVVESNKFSEYFKQTINSGSRMCYRFETLVYIKNLIETGVINWFSQQYRYEVLSQFVKKQFQQLEALPSEAEQPHYKSIFPQIPIKQTILTTNTKYNLKYDQFFAQYYIDKQHFCKGQRNQNKMTSVFKFCQHINIKMKYIDAQDKKYERKQQRTVVRLQQCGNGTLNGDKKQSKQCKRNQKQSGKRIRKIYQKEVNRYFLIPSQQKGLQKQNEQEIKRNELQLAFQIFPIKSRAPIFTFASNQYRAVIDNPVLSKQNTPNQNSQNSQESFQYSGNKKVLAESQDPLFLTSPSFYLILLNNYTSYQLYHQTIQISKPKLRIKNVIISGERIQKQQFQRNYFKDQFTEQDQAYKEKLSDLTSGSKQKLKKKISNYQKKRWLPIYLQESEITTKVYADKQFYSSIQVKQNQEQKTSETKAPELHQQQQLFQFEFNPEEERLKVRELISNGQIQQLFVQGQKVFQIANEGQADISYTHIGFQSQQDTCFYKGIRVIAGPCTQEWRPVTNMQSNKTQLNKSQDKSVNQKQNLPERSFYKLPPKSSSLIKIRYSIRLADLISQKTEKDQERKFSNYDQSAKIHSPTFRIYLYNSNSYYIQFLIKFKFSEQLQSYLKNISSKQNISVDNEKMFITKLWNIVLNILALVFICATIFKFRQDEDFVKKNMQKKGNIDFGQNVKASHASSSSNSLNYQKNYKKFRIKNQYLNGQQLGSPKESGQISYQIIEPSFYPFAIGTSFASKSSSTYHPIVTISEELLNSIRQEQKKQSKLLHNFFNESEESQILAKNQHEVNENISLTINLDQEGIQNENHNNNPQNQSISEESSFDFEMRNTSQEPQIRGQKAEQSEGSDFSQAEQSDLPDGQQVQITDEILNQSDQGFGFEAKKKAPLNNSQQRVEQQSQDKKQQGYYNVFFTSNPLKKPKQQINNTDNHPFSWMNEDKKRSRLKW